MCPARSPATPLPPYDAVLAVVAHPDDESFGLGAVLSAFVARGSRVAVLCFTHGEASTLHGVAGDLHRLRADELRAAAAELGVASTTLRDYVDGALREVCPTRLAGEVIDAARAVAASALLVFDSDGVTGHSDHVAATAAALRAAEAIDLPVLAWTLPAAVAAALNEEFETRFSGREDAEISYAVDVDRAAQRRAVQAHASQALATTVPRRRLELLGDTEHLRVLR